MPNCCPTCVEEMYGSGIDPATLVSGNYTVVYQDETDMPCSLNDPVQFDYLGVYVLPTPGDYTLYRRKWNYVRNLYSPIYQIDENGDWEDTRGQYTDNELCGVGENTPNMAYWLDVNKYKRKFYDHLFEWTDYASSRVTKAAIFERWLQWKYEIGSSSILYNNLPQHKRNDHFGHCWMLCPYDINNTENKMRAMLDLVPEQFPLEGRNNHGNYYMQTVNRGHVWGFECTSPTCPYRTAYGKPYFYS